MPTTVKLNYLRIAPRKVRLVADLIRGKSVQEAQRILPFTTKRGAPILLKLLKSAVASAKSQQQLQEQNLYISKLTVDEGPKLKRWMPRARGRAYEIQKKSSHITLVLDTVVNKSKIKRRSLAKPNEALAKSKSLFSPLREREDGEAISEHQNAVR